MKLLLAIDQSKDSKVAINLLRKFQWPAGTSLLLLHVATIEDEKRARASKNKNPDKSGKTLPNVQVELRRAEKLLGSDTLKVQTMVVDGIPGQEILTTIRRKEIDVVVLGSRGLSRASGLLMGSVSEWVLNDAPCSVLIARPTARKSKAASSLNVLLATDGSSDVGKAVKVLNKFVLPVGSNVMLLHVIKKHFYETGQSIKRKGSSWSAYSKISKDLCGERGLEGVRLLKGTRDALPSLALMNIEECLVLGHEASGILNAARQKKTDLIVVGSKGNTGLRRIFLGSVSSHVSQHAPCSVLVVRSLKKP